ncbi:MAG: hypothetical protein ACK2UC_12900 [Anaerolineae bacterium]|jgi:hypothetical protein
MMSRNISLVALLLVLVLVASSFAAPAAQAHRPYFEKDDIQASDPWLVDDPTISTALYATLDRLEDVDYFAFEGTEGDAILLALTIPQIEGQADFAPTMALLGPGLASADLPARVGLPAGAGAFLLEPPAGEATTFYEPFSRTSYWERQEQRVSLPASGRYVVAVWHSEGQVGRYTFVIGDKERLGGDLAFPFRMRTYWTPVEAPVTPTPVTTSPPATSCGQ